MAEKNHHSFFGKSFLKFLGFLAFNVQKDGTKNLRTRKKILHTILHAPSTFLSTE